MTNDEVRRWREGMLPPAEVLAVARHVSSCAECRDRAAAQVDSGRAVEGIRRELGRAEAPVRARWTRWAVAATLLLALFAAAAIFLRTRREPAAPVTPVVADDTAPPPPAADPAPAPPPREPQRYAREEWARLVADARAGGRLVLPAVLTAVRPPPDVLRDSGDPSPRSPLSPAGVVLDTQRPRFTWPASPDARYAIALFADGAAVTRAADLRDAAWTPPRPLRRATTYQWEVEVTRGEEEPRLLPEPPAPPALFHVVSEAESRALAEARGAHGDDHLLLALLYARSGMDAEAARELLAVPPAHPDAATARRLLRDLPSLPHTR